MKKGLLLFILVISAASSFALNKYEFILGLRGGAGALFYTYRVTDYAFPYTEKQIGVSIPAKGDVLFGLRGFRFGYRFEYTHNINTRFRRDFDDNLLVDLDTAISTKRNLFAHLFILEVA